MITSFLQLLERRYDDKLDDEAHEFIGFAVDGAKRLNNMINDLLEYSQVTRKDKEFVRINCEQILAETSMNLKVPIEESNAIISHDPLPVIVGDKEMLIELFQNLISNSIKYHGDDPPEIHISVKEENNTYRFSFKDNGIGMSSDHLDRIFTIFQRLHGKDEYEGTGIGLSIAQKIVHEHGGQIWVESEIGNGSTFYFTIPI
jgi:light-regulated signal transduction histidine kinase (bacteriophytochrome)